MPSFNKHRLSPLWTRPRADPAGDAAGSPAGSRTRRSPAPCLVGRPGGFSRSGDPGRVTLNRQWELTSANSCPLAGPYYVEVQWCRAPGSWLATEALASAPCPPRASHMSLEVTLHLGLLVCEMGPIRGAQPGDVVCQRVVGPFTTSKALDPSPDQPLGQPPGQPPSCGDVTVASATLTRSRKLTEAPGFAPDHRVTGRYGPQPHHPPHTNPKASRPRSRRPDPQQGSTQQRWVMSRDPRLQRGGTPGLHPQQGASFSPSDDSAQPTFPRGGGTLSLAAVTCT